MTHWIFWTGIGFIIAGLVSIGITLGGEGPPSFIDELLNYNIGWMIIGLALVIFGLTNKVIKKTLRRF